MIELMMVLAIIAILAAIALPSYQEYIMRGRLMDAHSKLADLRGQMDRYFLDQRTFQYNNTATCGIADPAINMVATYNLDGGRSFDIGCAAPTATTYILTATGRAARGMTGFTFTVNQANARSSTGPSGWPTVGCWFVRKSGDCS